MPGTSTTSLAVLAFLGAGYTPASRASSVDPVTRKTIGRGEVVRRALAWLVRRQAFDGSLAAGADEVGEQALATLALSEAATVTTTSSCSQVAQRAAWRLEAMHVRGLDWGKRKDGASAVEPTVWAILALEAASRSGLDVDEKALDDARARLRFEGLTASRTAGEWPTAAAAGLLAWTHESRERGRRDASVDAACAALAVDPVPPRACSVDEATHAFLKSLALFEQEGPRGERWIAASGPLKDALCEGQRPKRDGCLQGSWEGGEARATVTALDVMTLEIHYRYANAVGVRHEREELPIRLDAEPLPGSVLR